MNEIKQVTIKAGIPLRIEGQAEVYTVVRIETIQGRNVLVLIGSSGSTMRIML